MRTLQNTEGSIPLEVPKNNAWVVRLERNQKNVTQLRTKLNSYYCEPQTYSLYERIESLKKGLESLNNANKEIIASIKDHKKSAQEYVERIKQQFSEYYRLQKGVEEYMGLTRNY